MPPNLPDKLHQNFTWSAVPPDRIEQAEYYEGLLWRRPVAFLIDLVLISAVTAALWILNILTFGLLFAVIVFLWIAPIIVIYDTVTIGGPSAATIGMRLMGLEVLSCSGGKPSYLQALVMSALFCFLFAVTSGLILLLALFTDRRRCLHDMLSGTIVVNRRAVPASVA